MITKSIKSYKIQKCVTDTFISLPMDHWMIGIDPLECVNVEHGKTTLLLRIPVPTL